MIDQSTMKINNRTEEENTPAADTDKEEATTPYQLK